MYKLDHNIRIVPKNILELNKKIEDKNNFRIDTIKSLTNYFKKLKNKLIYDITSRLLQ